MMFGSRTIKKKTMTKIYLYHEYETPEEYQKHLRASGKPHDAVVVAGILYTMDEYDMQGRTITYGNRKHGKAMEIATQDRYGAQGFTDVVVSCGELTSWRNDIVYAE